MSLTVIIAIFFSSFYSLKYFAKNVWEFEYDVILKLNYSDKNVTLMLPKKPFLRLLGYNYLTLKNILIQILLRIKLKIYHI